MMSFPYLRSVPPPPSLQDIQVQQPAQPYLLPFVPNFGPPRQSGQNQFNGRGNFRGNANHSRGRGWSRKPPTFNNNYQHNNTPNGVVPNKSMKKPTCETCDRYFASPAELNEHIAQHQTCGREGCTFTAHPKVVAKHVEAQHDTGLYARMKKDEAQWIEQRKKKYPTQATVEKMKQETQEKIERGERIEKPNSRFGSRGRGGWRGGRRNHPYQKSTLHTPENTCQLKTDKQNTNSSEPQPVQSAPQEPKPEITAVTTTLKDVEKKTVMSNGNPLISLLGEYHSTESDSDSPPEETTVSRALSGPLPPSVTEIIKAAAPKVATPKLVRELRNPREQFKKRNRPPTLLQKLLEPEIRRERNILLQCVLYVVQKKFFQ